MIDITTNNVARDILNGYDLTEDERKEFDYIDWKMVEEGVENPEFVRYKGELYHLGDIERSTIPEWDGMVSETFFSGVLFKYTEDHEFIICGRFYVH